MEIRADARMEAAENRLTLHAANRQKFSPADSDEIFIAPGWGNDELIVVYFSVVLASDYHRFCE